MSILKFKHLSIHVVASRRFCSLAAKQSPLNRAKLSFLEIASSGRAPSSQRHY